MADEATNHADTYGRHGDPDPGKWQKAEAVTGRPADTPPRNSTLAERAALRTGAKQVDAAEAEDKAVKKAPAKKAAPKAKA